MTNTPSLDGADLARLVHAMADAVIVCGPEGTIVYRNDAAERVLAGRHGTLR